MYAAQKNIRNKTEMTTKPPFGPGFTQTQADEAETMDIECYSFKDDGADFTVFILRDGEGKVKYRSVFGGY
jgi:hypothetical protein